SRPRSLVRSVQWWRDTAGSVSRSWLPSAVPTDICSLSEQARMPASMPATTISSNRRTNMASPRTACVEGWLIAVTLPPPPEQRRDLAASCKLAWKWCQRVARGAGACGVVVAEPGVDSRELDVDPRRRVGAELEAADDRARLLERRARIDQPVLGDQAAS